MMPWETPQPDYNCIPDFLKRNEDGTLANPSNNLPAKAPTEPLPWEPTTLFRS